MASVYFSRWILLADHAILHNGAITVDNGVITSMGPRSRVKRTSGDRLVNLGNTLLLPGFINIHTRLEESFLRGIAPMPGESFSSRFAKKNTRLRTAEPSEVISGARLCCREYLSRGITTVADHSRQGVSPAILAAEPLRAWVFHEVHPEDPEQEAAVMELLAGRLRAHPEGVGAGVGPYSLFSLSPETHRRVAALAQANSWRWAVHIAESAEELQAFSERAGDLFFHLTRKKPWAYGDAPSGPMHYALSNGLIPNHAVCSQCNYVNGHELALLAAKRVSVVTSIRYTDAMGHNRFPLEVALDRRINLCVATESVAETDCTDLLDELYWFHCAYPHIPAGDMLDWITRNPAEALGVKDRLGSLAEGMCADIAGFSFEGDPGERLLEELICEDHEVRLVMVNGEEIIANY